MTKDRELVWAAWSADAISIHWQRQGKTGAQVSPLLHSTHADWRYFLRLYRLNDGTFLLRNGDSRGTSLYRAKSNSPFHPVKDWPDLLASLPPNQIIPRKDGMVAGIVPDQSRLSIWQPDDSLLVYELPEGFILRDIDRDHLNRLWICGALPTRKLKSLKYRHAFAMSDDGVSWQVSEAVHGNLKVAWRSLLSGAEAMYRTINVVNDYLVLSAETDDFDSTSTLLFVRDAHGKWRSGILQDDILRAVLPTRHGGLEIISHYGQAVSINSPHKWRHQSLIPRIHNLMQSIEKRVSKDARYEILDAQSSPSGERILVVSVRLPGDDHLIRFGEALVALTEENDYLITFHNQGDSEIITASC